MQCDLISGELVVPTRPKLRAVSHASKCSVNFSLPHIHLKYTTNFQCFMLDALWNRCQCKFYNHILVSDVRREELHTSHD